MKTWQSILIHLGLTLGAAFLPSIKDPTVQTALGAIIATGTAVVARSNSHRDPNGNPLAKTIDDKFITKT
jgi:hypothetical protein